MKVGAERIGMMQRPNFSCASVQPTKLVQLYIDQLTSKLTDTGVRIKDSGKSLKILGFEFDQRPGPVAQVDRTIAKVRSRMGSIRYIKQAGMGKNDLAGGGLAS